MLIGNRMIEQYEYNIKLLSSDDEVDVQALCERCLDFWELVEGRPPEKSAGSSILLELPTNKGKIDKYVFGVYGYS